MVVRTDELRVHERATPPWYFVAKRCTDVVLAVLLLVVLSPVLAVVALAVVLDSPGPVLFRQTRVGAARVTGRDGAETWYLTRFAIFKFRSMHADADQTVHVEHVRSFTGRALPVHRSGSAKVLADPRITRVGRVLRRLSLDELPQLLNVVRGEMSLVGPRPVPVYEVAGYGPEHYARFAARPGITGLWQVTGRGRVTFDEMVALDVALIRRRSILYELGILLRTLPAVVRGSGAS